MKFKSKSILAAAVALTLSASAHAVDITFDPTGTAGPSGNITTAAIFDWSAGNALSIGGDGITTGENLRVLYQANLTAVQDSTTFNVFSNGAGGNFFTVIASFTEIATVGGVGATFATDTSNNTAVTATNFFQICAQATIGSNLAGTGFGCSGGSVILSGYVSSLSSASFAVTDSATLTTALDQSANNVNSYPKVFTVTGSGATDITATITSANANYFPTLASGSQFVFSFFNTSQIVPYKQIDPSALFSLNGSTATYGGAGTANIGTMNGGLADGSCPTGFTCGNDFMFQADANQSFITRAVPEPATVGLLGLGLAAFGAFGRARRRKSA